MPIVSSLFVYPIKSCAGVSLQSLRFDSFGPLFDRRLMVVDTNGRFLTQRENPLLATIQPRILNDRISVQAHDAKDFSIPNPSKRRIEISLWKYQGQAMDVGDSAAEWFSEVLDQSCRLVALDPDQQRPTKRSPLAHESRVAFADGYPVSLVSLESLSELNRRLATPVPLNRFRPNIVVRDCHPFAEDKWATLQGPDVKLCFAAACTRCKITTIDQLSLVQSKEPLATLGTFRHAPAGVTFGQNCVVEGAGSINVGDTLFSTPSSS